MWIFSCMQLAYENSNYSYKRTVTHCDVLTIFGIYMSQGCAGVVEPFPRLPLQASIKRGTMQLNTRFRGILAGLVLLVGVMSPALAGGPFNDLVSMSGEEMDGLPQADDGKWTLVMFWATDCHACEAQKPDISAFSDKHKDGDISVVGISLDGRSNLVEIREHEEASKATFDSYVGELVLIASNIKLLTDEDFRGTPTYMLLDPENNVIAYNPGMLVMSDLDSFVARNVYGQ